MGLRICFVTPFSWSQPHDVNEHVRGAAEALRRRGHTVTIVAPSSRAADLLDGRRALQRGVVGETIAIGAAVPTSLSDRVALPMGVRANLATTLALGAFDVVHGFEPGLPSLSSAALVEAETTTAATFLSTERIAVPPRKNQPREVPRPGRRAPRDVGERGRARVRAVPGRLRDDPARRRHDGLRPGSQAPPRRRGARAGAERRRAVRAPRSSPRFPAGRSCSLGRRR